MTQPIGYAMTNTDPNSCVTVRSDRLGKPWHVSKKGLVFIAVLESGILDGRYNEMRVVDGFILEVYDDGFGIPTVGLGHRVTRQDGLILGDKISVQRAQSFLLDDLKKIEPHINRDVMVPLYQYEYDALVSILWNTGAGRKMDDRWQGTRCEYLASHVNTGEYDKMPAIIENFVSHRVPHRRKREARLFSQGIYDAND
jgi:lysozyme